MLLKLVVRQPSLLLNHAQAYVDLAVDEGRRMARGWRTRALLYAASLMLFNLGLVWGGVALLLWSVLPVTAAQTSWVLVALPLGCEVLAVICFVAAQGRGQGPVFAVMQEQLKLDVLALREAKTASSANAPRTV